MKKIKKKILKTVVKAVDAPVIAAEWPPNCPMIFYQPKRVKKEK